jgi:hypothetical protein
MASKRYVHELVPHNVLFSNQRDAIEYGLQSIGVPVRIVKSGKIALIRSRDTDKLLRTVIRREIKRLEK